MTSSLGRPSPSRLILRVVLFLLVFSVLLVLISNLYLLPAMEAAHGVDDPKQKRQLSAIALLVMCVVLFVLFAALLLTFRVGRFFFPGAQPKRAKPTEYVDAWAEAGRRMQAPPATDVDDGPGKDG